MKKMQRPGFVGWILASVLLSGLFCSVNADDNPLIRNCRPEGHMWSVTSEVGELPLCLIESAAIGAKDIFAFKTDSTKAQSIRLFLSLPQINDAEGMCITQAGQVLSAIDSDNKNWKVCQLSDGSLIELATLGRGSAHASNKALHDLLLR